MVQLTHYVELNVQDHAYIHRHTLRTVNIIDSNETLTLLPLTVATFTQILPETLLLSLDLRHCCEQAENTLLLLYTHSAMRNSSCTHSFRGGRKLKSSHWFVVVTVLSVIR